MAVATEAALAALEAAHRAQALGPDLGEEIFGREGIEEYLDTRYLAITR